MVTTAISLAALLCVVDIGAYASASTWATHLAFGVLTAAFIGVLVSYFYGIFMAMNGNIPTSRLKIFLPHAVVGSLTPLVYMLNLSIAFDNLDQRRLGLFSLVAAFISLGVITVQYLMGRRVVRVDRLKILTTGEMPARFG